MAMAWRGQRRWRRSRFVAAFASLLALRGVAAADAAGAAADGGDEPPPCTFESCPVCLGGAKEAQQLTVVGPDGLGHQAPLRIGRAEQRWDAQSVYAQITGILVQERLGIEVVYAPCLDEVMCYMAVNNCIGWQDYQCDQLEEPEEGEAIVIPAEKQFQDPLSDLMFVPVIFYDSMAFSHFNGTQLDYDRRGGISLGPSGHTFVTGLYVWADIVDRAWAAAGVDLLWLREFERPEALAYFHTPAALMSAGVRAEVVGCSNDTVRSVKAGMAEHRALGWACNQSWWLTPACAAFNESWVTSCIPMLDDDWGSRKPELYNGIVQSGVPVAKLTVGYTAWRELLGLRRYNVSFAWWSPDATLLAHHPRRVTAMPELEPQPQVVLKAAWAPAMQANTQLSQFLEAVYMTVAILADIMENVSIALADNRTSAARNASNFYQKIACDWLVGHEDVWSEWFPSARSCSQGQVYNEAAQQCAPCPQGTSFVSLRNGTRLCEVCAPGTFAASEGMLECSPCPRGTHQDRAGAILCEKCEAGTRASETAQLVCQDCEPGRATATIGASECALCVPGTYADGGATSCSVCATGSYSDSAGAFNCTMCELPLITGGRGSASQSDCVCPKGQYKAAGGPGCRSCPARMVCEQGSSELSLLSVASHEGPALDALGREVPYPKVEESYWTARGDPLSVYRCEGKLQCPGGDPDTCTDHMQDQGCAHCQAGWNWDGKQCIECTGVESSQLIFPGLPCVLAFFIIIGLYLTSGDPYETWNNWTKSIAVLGFLALNHYQVLALLKGVNIQLPQLARQTFTFWSFTEDVLSVFKFGCVGYGDFKSNMIFRSVSPLALFGVTVICLAGSRLLAFLTQKPWLGMDRDRTHHIFFSLIFTFFNGIAALSLSLFKCTSSPNGKLTLSNDPSVDCYQGQWNDLIIVAAFAVVVYCVGASVVFTWAIYAATGNQRFCNRGFQMRWKFLFIKFRADVHWWAIVLLARGVLINAAFVGVSEGLGQLYWIMMQETLYLSLTILCMPWRHRGANVMAIATSISIVYSCALLAIYADRDDNLDSNVALMAVTFSFLPTLVFVVLAVLVIVRGLGCRHERTLKYEELYEAAQGILCLDENTVTTIFHDSGEWDRFYLQKFCEVIRAEYMGMATATRAVSRTLTEAARASLQRSSLRGSSSRLSLGNTKVAAFATVSI